jgi:hypothetical protein
MTSDDGPVRVTYRGSAKLAFALAECLEGEGAEIIWTPPEEHRSRSGRLHEIIIDMVVCASEETAESASLAVARAGRDKFRKRFPDGGTVEIEDDHE